MNRLLVLLVLVATILVPSLPALAQSSHLYWVERSNQKIRRADLNGQNAADVLTSLNDPVDVAVDRANGKLYWIEQSGGKLRRANLDGSGAHEVVTGLLMPEAVAVDPAGGKVYWSETGRIARANLDGSSVQVLVTTAQVPNLSVFGLTLDVAGGKLYWGNPADATVRRVNLDGTGSVETIVTGVAGGFGVAVDAANGFVYVMDNGGSIVRASLTGAFPAAKTTLVSGLGTNQPKDLVLDVPNNRMYFTLAGTGANGSVQRAALDGSGRQMLAGGLAGAWGLALSTAPPSPGGSGTLAVAPFSITFPIIPSGTTTAAHTVTIANTGASGMTVSGFYFAGPHAAEFVLGGGGTCAPAPFVLAAGASCTVGVVFAPVQAGAKQARMVVATSAAGEGVVHLFAIADWPVRAPGPDIALSSTFFTFSITPVGQVETQTLTVRNEGTSPLSITGLSVNSADFGASGCLSAIQPGSTCALSLSFAPQSAGAKQGILTLTTNDSDEPEVTVVMIGIATNDGTGAQPGLSVSTAAHHFGTVDPGSSQTFALTVRNTGNAALLVSNATMGGPSAGDFTVTNGCAALAPGAACTITVGFHPVVPGAKMAQLTIASNAPRAGTVQVMFTGIARIPGSGGDAPEIGVDPLGLAFPVTAAGQVSGVQTFTITNSGVDPLAISNIAITGTHAAEYAIDSTTCPASLFALQACTVNVVFSPATPGGKAALLQITSNDPDEGVLRLGLAGNGAPVVTPMSTPLMTSGSAGPESPPVVVTVSNPASQSLGLEGFALVGTDPDQFRITGTTCGNGLDAGSRCTIEVTFAPTTDGSKGALLRIATAHADVPTLDVVLMGEAGAEATDIGTGDGLPVVYALHPNYPNPFEAKTTLHFDLPEAGAVRLVVYDVLGREVSVLADEVMPAGTHRLTFDASDLPAGTYVYRLETEQGTQTRRMVRVK